VTPLSLRVVNDAANDVSVPRAALPPTRPRVWTLQAETFNEKVFLTAMNDAGTLSSEVAMPEA
jgi:hypothetical protein